MVPELTSESVERLATAFLDTNTLLPHPITLTTFVGYAFPTDDEHPEPWGKRAGQLRRAIRGWMQARSNQIDEALSKRGKPTTIWRDPLKIAALRARNRIKIGLDGQATKRFVKELVEARLS